MQGERVQEIASVSENIPTEFIRPENEQPRFTTFTGQSPKVPVIDFSINDQENLRKLIYNASCEWGFFQIINHDIPSDVISKFKEVGTDFFELSPEEKEVYAKPPDAKSLEGYGTKLQKEIEGKKAWVDHLFHYISPPSIINYRFWPKNPPSYRESTEEYGRYLHRVVDKLLNELSLGLGLEGNEVRDAVGGDDLVYNLKINYYPPCPRPDLALGVPAHTDMSALTVLVPNEVPGLQVFQNENWINVDYIPNALVIHIGDQLEILSNGKYKSVMHRTTVSKDKTRMSWPVFIEPPKELSVGPHPNLITPQNPPNYNSNKFSHYVYCKLNKIPQ